MQSEKIIITNFVNDTRDMDPLKKLFASKLLEIKAVKLSPDAPFTWASGWKSPIYCDNRKVNSYPAVRTYVKTQLAHHIITDFPNVEMIAGVATGAISQGALVADLLNLPFVYVRPNPKDHGLGNQIEGDLEAGEKVVVVEDLISTGGSSLKAVEALRLAGAEVIGMVASHTYGFPAAAEAFRRAGVKLITLTDYDHIIAQAVDTGYVSEDDVEMLRRWRENPAEWGK